MLKWAIRAEFTSFGALQGALVAILRSRSKRIMVASSVIGGDPLRRTGYRVGGCPEQVIEVPKTGSLNSLLIPSEPAFFSLQGSLNAGTRKEYQMTDIERLITA